MKIKSNKIIVINGKSIDVGIGYVYSERILIINKLISIYVLFIMLFSLIGILLIYDFIDHQPTIEEQKNINIANDWYIEYSKNNSIIAFRNMFPDELYIIFSNRWSVDIYNMYRIEHNLTKEQFSTNDHSLWFVLNNIK